MGETQITDLIKRDDAPDPPEYLCTFPLCSCVEKGQWCPAPRSPAAIREAAWMEALDAAHEYTLTQYGVGFLKHPVDRERILALIGEKK